MLSDARPSSLMVCSSSSRPCRCVRRCVLRLKAQAADPDNFRLPSQPLKSATLAPSLLLSPPDAVEAQLKALTHNNFPVQDHGIEVLYRFSNIDPWTRSLYFGRSLDLGQYERFRRILYTNGYYTLLGHTEHTLISSLEVAEDCWKVRALVKHGYRKEEAVFEFSMRQRTGGRYDGVWFTQQLICDGVDDKHVYGVI